MIPVPSGVRVWLATGATDMRRGMNGLALQVQQALQRDRIHPVTTAEVFAAPIPLSFLRGSAS